MKKHRKRKCRHCGGLYKPDARNRHHQYTCSDPACQKARHRANQQKWTSRPENEKYFCGPAHVKRVQAWREANPGYWRKNKKPLQDDSETQPVDNQQDKGRLTPNALQDGLLLQPAVLVGLISILTGDVLQDDIALDIQRYHHRGQQILHPKGKGNDDDQTCVMSGSPAEGSGAVQLGGP